VTKGKRFVVHGLSGRKVINVPIADLKEAWQAPLTW